MFKDFIEHNKNFIYNYFVEQYKLEHGNRLYFNYRYDFDVSDFKCKFTLLEFSVSIIIYETNDVFSTCFSSNVDEKLSEILKRKYNCYQILSG